MIEEKDNMLSTKEVAARIGVKYTTVMMWLREKKLAGAVKVTPRVGNPYWLIPESAIVDIVKRSQGRPKKAKPSANPVDEIPVKPKPRVPTGTATKKALKKRRKTAAGN
jgi:excisionase family DNA binding protein